MRVSGAVMLDLGDQFRASWIADCVAQRNLVRYNFSLEAVQSPIRSRLFAGMAFFVSHNKKGQFTAVALYRVVASFNRADLSFASADDVADHELMGAIAVYARQIHVRSALQDLNYL